MCTNKPIIMLYKPAKPSLNPAEQGPGAALRGQEPCTHNALEAMYAPVDAHALVLRVSQPAFCRGCRIRTCKGFAAVPVRSRRDCGGRIMAYGTMRTQDGTGKNMNDCFFPAPACVRKMACCTVQDSGAMAHPGHAGCHVTESGSVVSLCASYAFIGRRCALFK